MRRWWKKIIAGHRHFRQHTNDAETAEQTVQPALEQHSETGQVSGTLVVARQLADFFVVVEVGEADFFVGDLFRRRFACDSFPDTPKHFVALYKTPEGSLLPLGYVHFEMWQQQALGGGLVFDERAWRRLPASERDVLRECGGVAKLMLERAIGMLPEELVAIWGYVGDKQAEKVDLSVGFRHTGVPYVMVIWRNDPGEEEKKRLLQKIVELGPF